MENIEKLLAKSLDDERLSRAEHSVLKQLLSEQRPDIHQQEKLLSVVYQMVNERIYDPRDKKLIEWLIDVVKTIRPAKGIFVSGSRLAESWFMPSNKGFKRLLSLLDQSRNSIKLCMFTVTHNDLARALRKAHQSGVHVKILTDNEKSQDLGSDIEQLSAEGIEVRMDDSIAHMHNKFCIIDNKILVTGSFNWTRAAAEENQESFIVTDDTKLVAAHIEEFEKLWVRFSPAERHA
jgi:phosphatidylserine/phosphatidylglycerophosphate/cardiolipin synthase-like enzyme